MRAEDGWEFDQASHPGMKRCLSAARQCSKAAVQDSEVARIKWMFTTDKARAKMGHAYPNTPKES